MNINSSFVNSVPAQIATKLDGFKTELKAYRKPRHLIEKFEAYDSLEQDHVSNLIASCGTAMTSTAAVITLAPSTSTKQQTALRMQL